jgi:UDP-N-acetylmuramate dehydrogenase
MNIISEINEIKNKISGKLLFNESLSKYSWFNLGGPAKIIFKPKNLNELSLFLKKIKGFDKIKVLGGFKHIN